MAETHAKAVEMKTSLNNILPGHQEVEVKCINDLSSNSGIEVWLHFSGKQKN